MRGAQPRTSFARFAVPLDTLDISRAYARGLYLHLWADIRACQQGVQHVADAARGAGGMLSTVPAGSSARSTWV